MKRFLYKSSVYLGILTTIILCYCFSLHIYLLSHPDRDIQYSHEINFSKSIYKLKSKTQPTIIILGGSGCGFGFISENLKEHYDMPVINVGTHAGIGLHLIMAVAKPYVSKDDIILLIPEYHHFNENFLYGENAALNALYSAPELFSHVNLHQYFHLLKFYPRYCENIIRKQANYSERTYIDTTNVSPYSRFSLNEYGDVTSFNKRTHQDIALTEPCLKHINTKTIDEIKDFMNYSCEIGAMCIFLPPAYRDVQFDLEKESIYKLTMLLSKMDVNYPAEPIRYRLNDSLFYDTPYHLTYEGCVYRTQLVIEDIDRILKKE